MSSVRVATPPATILTARLWNCFTPTVVSTRPHPRNRRWQFSRRLARDLLPRQGPDVRRSDILERYTLLPIMATCPVIAKGGQEDPPHQSRTYEPIDRLSLAREYSRTAERD